MSLATFGETFVTLFVVMDPIGTAPVFLSLTSAQSRSDARRSALVASLAAMAVVLVFALFGQAVLSYLQVSLASLSIAGGLLLVLVALEMLQGQAAPPEDQKGIALVPLATPLLAGPGAIATVMVLVRQHPGAGERVGVYLGILATVVVIAAIFLLADQLSKWISAAALHFLTRIFGFLLTAIAVQLVVDGALSLARG
ncbi:MAG TPA: MarC family protein [Acidimicrobiales bacterium]|nr:MarC family protein [Acidimicrobiales bacterium]